MGFLVNDFLWMAQLEKALYMADELRCKTVLFPLLFLKTKTLSVN